MSEEGAVKDFFGVYDATLKFIAKRYGQSELQRYLQHIFRNYHQDLIEDIKKRGLEALNGFFHRVHQAEGAKYSIQATRHLFKMEITSCPQINWLKENDFEPYEGYCAHCGVQFRIIAKDCDYDWHHQYDQALGRCSVVLQKADG